MWRKDLKPKRIKILDLPADTVALSVERPCNKQKVRKNASDRFSICS